MRPDCRGLVCQLAQSQELSAAATGCMCNRTQPYLYCKFVLAPEQRAFVGQAVEDWLSTLSIPASGLDARGE
jgi:hypothetical protein